MTPYAILAYALWERFGYLNPISPNDMAQFILDTLDNNGYVIGVKK